MLKQILVFARKSMKLTILIAVSVFLIICAVALFFKPIYSVTINGEMVGYTDNKSKLQTQINEYIENNMFALFACIARDSVTLCNSLFQQTSTCLLPDSINGYCQK